ncbi:MAG: flavin reductase family protein [Cytophagaceae bacterium]|jgi:flavin reductase (DIM6/NTAB) family NADH-FMN oxidoreductase RutF|nr:flavin reductase family protein [Cytophagaceae bacterium]
MNVKQQYFSRSDISFMEKHYRTHFVNSLGGFKSVCLVASANNKGNLNLAVFNSIVHLGADPPLMGCILRPDSVERHTLDNILETGYYSFNHIQQSFYQAAHQASAKYPREVSEFEATGLHSEYKNHSSIPYVKESLIQIGLKFVDRILIPVNGTSLLIGSIEEVYVHGDSIRPDGFIELSTAGTMAGTGLDGYAEVSKIKRLSYAKPGTMCRELDY